MSMIGELRAVPANAFEALEAKATRKAALEQVMDADGTTLDKAWNGLWYLLELLCEIDPLGGEPLDWYDTGYSVEQKRRIIKTALTVRRLMGTVGAVKMQADAIYPGTMLEEWFEYGGQPGTFRLYINVTDTTEEHPAIIYSPAEMERRLITAKRWSAHLESLSYMVRHTLATGCRVDKWAYTVPECGTIYCGVWWMPATLGYTAHHALLTGGQPGAFAVSPEFTGTLPVPATVGYSVCGALRSGGVATGYTASPEFAGTLPEEAQHGN